MAPKTKRMKSRHPSNPAVVADCEDIMLCILMCILTRLPVKSIIRFKSVCKPWLHLLSTAEFRKMHQAKFSSDPKNESLLVHRINKNGRNTISVINIESNEKDTILVHPFIYDRVEIDIVGCCKGLVCLSSGRKIVLWNSAMDLFMTVWPELDPFVEPYHENVSLGLGYDAEFDDCKVLRIVRLINMRDQRRMKVNRVEVYSVNSGSWTKVEPSLQFTGLWTKGDVIVNGNPYWVVKVDENKVLICFDIKKLIFKIVPLSTLDFDEESAEVEFIVCDGSIGARVFTWENEEQVSYVADVWAFDDGDQIWRKKQRVGPIDQVKVDRVLLCLEDGRVFGKRPKDQLILFNPETRSCVKSLFNVAPEGQDFEIYGYSQSLTHIEGMEKVTPRRRALKYFFEDRCLRVYLFSFMNKSGLLFKTSCQNSPLFSSLYCCSCARVLLAN